MSLSHRRIARMQTISAATRRLTRRRLLVAGAAVVASGRLAGDDAAAQSGTPVAAGGWSFTDDHGTTVSLPERPERIVAYVGSAATLWDYGIRPVGVFGSLLREDGSKTPLAGNVDPDAIAWLGEGGSELDLEALVALQPELIVAPTYSPDVPGDLWWLEPDVAEQATRIAPAVAISVFETPVTASLARFEELAVALGADLEAPGIIAARERFAEASDAVRQAAAKKPDLRVLVISAWPEAIYVANPQAASDLLYFQELGVNLVAPDNPDSYWEELSWEQALRYSADLILLDERDGGFTAHNLDEAPRTLAAHPAVKAGQVGNWYTEFVLSYDAFAAILEELAEAMRESKVLR
jgi:iron complex transport system substrate-binding protein